jgi:hypothetical protein
MFLERGACSRVMARARNPAVSRSPSPLAAVGARIDPVEGDELLQRVTVRIEADRPENGVVLLPRPTACDRSASRSAAAVASLAATFRSASRMTSVQAYADAVYSSGSRPNLERYASTKAALGGAIDACDWYEPTAA